MHFHCAFFRSMTPNPAARFLFKVCWRLVYTAAAAVVILDHGREFRLLDFSRGRLIGHWFKMGRKIEELALSSSTDLPLNEVPSTMPRLQRD